MKYFKKTLLSTLIAFSACAHAEEVVFEFEGELNNENLDNNGFGTHPVGTKFTGYLVYDNDQIDQVNQGDQAIEELLISYGITPSKTKSTYSYTELSITIGEDTVIDYGPGTIDITDKSLDEPSGISNHSSDSIFIYSSSNLDATVGGLALGGLSLWLIDPTGEAFNNQSIPEKIDLANFSYGQIQLKNNFDYNFDEIEFTDIEESIIVRGDILIDSQEIAYEFEGELNEAFGDYPIGTPYAATLVYDTNQEDQTPEDSSKGQYAYKTLSINIGDDTAIDYGTGVIDVYNLNNDDPNDTNSHTSDLIEISSTDISAINTARPWWYSVKRYISTFQFSFFTIYRRKRFSYPTQRGK